MKKQFYLPHQKQFLLGHWGLRLLIWLLTTATAGAQTIRYVKPDGAGTGSSWAQASADLQAMINASSEGDQVWVAGGTYKPGGNASTDRTISFNMKSGVAIYGGFAGTEVTLSERPASVTLGQPSSSILSGDIGAIGTPNDNSQTVVYNSGVDSTAILDGLVIANGFLNYPYSYGAGLVNSGSSPRIRHCFFINNTANRSPSGGGMYNSSFSKPVLTSCTFENNSGGGLNMAAAIYSESGGVVTLNSCIFVNNRTYMASPIQATTILMTDCRFSGNSGGEFGRGGGAAQIGSGSVLTNCLFSNNRASGDGGALVITGDVTITNCTFRGNRAEVGGSPYNNVAYGGAIYGGSANSVISNCSFSANRNYGVLGSGGGAVGYSNATFINCSFANNSSNGAGGAFWGGSPKLINCIVWGNTPNGIGVTNATLTYTDTQDGTTGTGNFNADPLFVDAPSDNLRLRACSPAIDRGDNSVSVGTTDVLGNPRRVRTIDLGAYEFQGTPLLPVAVTQQPNRSYSIPQGGTLTASTSTTGAVAGHQWYKDGMALTGNTSATSATLTIANLAPSDDGNYYMVVTGSCSGDSDTSNTFRLYVNTGMYTVKTGSWDDPTVWALNRIPVSTDPVRIKHLVTIPAGYVAYARRVSYDTGQRLRVGSKGRLWLNH